MSKRADIVYGFESFLLDQRRRLPRGGGAGEVAALTQKCFDVLLALSERAGTFSKEMNCEGRAG